MTDGTGVTPLIMAAVKGQQRCVELLLDAGADRTIAMTGSAAGMTAVDAAKAMGHESIVALELGEGYTDTDVALFLTTMFPAPSPVERLLAEIPSASVRAKVSAAVAVIRGGARRLCLVRETIGNEGASTIAAVLAGSSLTTLDLAANKIGDKGASAIAAVLAESSLTTLELWGNYIGPEGAKAIAVVLAGSSLTTLSLNDNEIGDDGGLAIAAVLAGSSLTTLSLHRNNIYGSQGGVTSGPSGVRGELVKAWKAKRGHFIHNPVPGVSLLYLARRQIVGQSGLILSMHGE
jgi:hypothetical protein